MLPEEIVRGDVFEIFVEGYLRTMAVFQCTDLWLVGQVPLDYYVTQVATLDTRNMTHDDCPATEGAKP